MIEFLLGMVLALVAGTAQITTLPGVSSTDPSPYVIEVTWTCPGEDAETCFLLWGPGHLHTGP